MLRSTFQPTREVTVTLRRKILLGYGSAIVLIVFVLAWAVINLVQLGRASDAILRDNYRSIVAAESMIAAIERQDSASLLVALGYLDEGVAQFRENEALFLQSLTRAQDNITVEGEAAVLQSIESGYAAYVLVFQQLYDLEKSGSSSSAGFYHETVLPAFKTVRQTCQELTLLNQEAMYAASSRAGLVANRAIWSTLTVGLAAALIGLIFSLVLSRVVSRPAAELKSAAKQLAKGDYSARVPVTTSDELGALAIEFNSMAARLEDYHTLNVEQLVEEKSRSEAVIASIADGIILVDPAFRLVNMNEAGARLLDVQRDSVLGRHFLEVIKSERLFSYLREAVESEKRPEIAEDKNTLTIRRGEEETYLMFSVTPVRDSEAGMRGAVLLLRDVTRLKELDRLKSEFVMTASHELRTPLAGIELSIDLLRETAVGHLTPKENELLAAAREEVTRLKTLVNDLLDLSRIEAGKIELFFEQTDVGALFERVVPVFRAQFQEKSVELVVETGAGPVYARADPSKIAWVLTNLLSNALRYVRPGGRVMLSLEADGPWALVGVRDNGSGIPYEYQSRIFDKFVQVAGDDRGGGSGLGLTISREIIRAHGGTIWVDSIPGEGSTFTFTLPLAGR